MRRVISGPCQTLESPVSLCHCTYLMMRISYSLRKGNQIWGGKVDVWNKRPRKCGYNGVSCGQSKAIVLSPIVRMRVSTKFKPHTMIIILTYSTLHAKTLKLNKLLQSHHGKHGGFAEQTTFFRHSLFFLLRFQWRQIYLLRPGTLCFKMVTFILYCVIAVKWISHLIQFQDAFFLKEW